jgi:hypothetical protein
MIIARLHEVANATLFATSVLPTPIVDSTSFRLPLLAFAEALEALETSLDASLLLEF